ncbi:MAG: hypothetical protein AABM30_08515 [Actinomycetota bacterium]
MSHRVKKAVAVAEIVVLGPAAAILVLGVVPDRLGIEDCELFDSTNASANYTFGFFMATIASWLVLIAGTVAAFLRGLPNVGTALAPVWFIWLVLSSVVVATAIGPQPCQGGGWPGPLF